MKTSRLVLSSLISLALILVAWLSLPPNPMTVRKLGLGAILLSSHPASGWPGPTTMISTSYLLLAKETTI